MYYSFFCLVGQRILLQNITARKTGIKFTVFLAADHHHSLGQGVFSSLKNGSVLYMCKNENILYYE